MCDSWLQDAPVPVLDVAIELENASSDVLCETETTVTLDGLEIGGELFAASWSEPSCVARCGAMEEVFWFDAYRLSE